jgi:hypothetical protein
MQFYGMHRGMVLGRHLPEPGHMMARIDVTRWSGRRVIAMGEGRGQ